jgi:hypothetical protein
MGRPSKEEIETPCICGGEVGVWRGNSIDGPYHYAECFGCGRKTKHYGNHSRAVGAWKAGSILPAPERTGA